MHNLDAADLIDFATQWASLGDAVTGQVVQVVDNPEHADVNPAAIRLARERLTGLQSRDRRRSRHLPLGEKIMSNFTGIAPVDRLLADAAETRNQQGNRRRQIFLSADRYLFDFNMNLGEWEQFDTTSDAWYFGVWVNKPKRQILHYVEGDVFLTLCDDPESYDAEIAAMCVYYEPAPAFVAIDVEKGQRTEYYQGRVQFFIDPARANVPDIPEAGTTPKRG